MPSSKKIMRIYLICITALLVLVCSFFTNRNFSFLLDTDESVTTPGIWGATISPNDRLIVMSLSDGNSKRLYELDLENGKLRPLTPLDNFSWE